MKMAAENPCVATSRDVLEGWQEPRWYALFVRTNQERRVAHALSQREVEHLLPCYSAIHQWKDRRVKLQLPLFPGYLFVRLPLVERLLALTVPNVICLVGKKNAPSILSDEEIAAIRNASMYGQAQPHADLAEGERVIITLGPLTGMRGVLLRAHNRARVVVSVESISRAFVVEVDAACVEPLQESTAASFPHFANPGQSPVLPRWCAVSPG
jgi:transcription antitermination factor NusG